MTNTELADAWSGIMQLWPKVDISPAEASVWQRRLGCVDVADFRQAIEDIFAGGESRPRLADVLARVRGMRMRRDADHNVERRAVEMEEFIKRDEAEIAAANEALSGVHPREFPWCHAQAVPNCPAALKPDWQKNGSFRYRVAFEAIARWISDPKNMQLLLEYRSEINQQEKK